MAYQPPPGFYYPGQGVPPGYRPPDTGAVRGVPWETPGGGILGRWFDTLREASFGGRDFYRAVGQSDEVLSPVLFNAVTWAIVGAIAGAAYLFLFTLLGGLFYSFAKMFHEGLAMRGAAMSFGYGAMLWAITVAVSASWGFVGPWLLGGLHHLVLMLLGGVGRGGYAHSVRAHAYANAGASIWIVIPPVLGLLIAPVLHAKNHIEGYDGVHGCGGGKAFVAWLVSPLCTVCGCCSLFFALAA